MAFKMADASVKVTAKATVLHPGAVACRSQGERLETLLGSCVAIVLTDPRRTIGAMCHIVSCPTTRGGAKQSAAYADVALAQMYSLLQAKGINPRLCDAYVYGGGNMFPRMIKQSHVGQANANWALDALARDGVRILVKDVGGHAYRRLSWTVGPEAPRVTAVPV